MTENEFRSMDSLNLSWPRFVNYHVDFTTNRDSSTGNGLKDQSPDTGSQEPVTTYNGVPREHIRNSQPLLGNEIRVLDLKNGVPGTILVGSLRRVRLSDTLSNKDVYEPLSYTWEDDDTIQPCDNTAGDDDQPLLFLSDSDCALKLTSNCAKALCSVRKPTTERTIWVDSICVNQDDRAERSRQVDLMKEIYARAFVVLVYLGRESTQEDSSSNIAMSLLRQPDGLQQLDRRERTSIQLLFDRRYFRRTWIVQEVALAQSLEFHCGPDIAYVSKFAGKPLEAILGSKLSPPWLRHSKQAIQNLPNAREKSQAEQLLSLIFDTALCDCTDDRDRIFALFSLLNTSDKEPLRADYSLSTPQVYTGLSAYLAKNDFLWGVLMLAPRLALNKSLGLPTWVPDWSSLGKAGLQAPIPDSKRRVPGIRALRPDMGFVVGRSGIMAIRGMFLGSVTISGNSSGERHGNVDRGESPYSASFSNKRKRDGSPLGDKLESRWTLTMPTQKNSLEAWKCYFQFKTRCMRLDNVDHRAFMLPDYSTVLIVKPNNNFCDHYDLVESGQPLLQISLPRDWEEGLQTHQKGRHYGKMSFHLVKPITEWKQSHWDTILSSKEKFPGLSQLSELWSFNPFTLSLTLKYKAIKKIRSVSLTELDLLQRWQGHARTCVHVLQDKTQLQLLIHKVKGLCHQDYRQMEIAAGLDRDWSLDHFLGLFIRDPFKVQPMVWPDVQLRGATPAEEMDILPQLMQWACATRQFLKLVSEGPRPDFPELFMDYAIGFWANLVTGFQVSTASVEGTADESGGPGRTSILLERILFQIPDGSNLEVEQVEGPIRRNERYWDWKRFDSIMGQRLYTLGLIKPDVERIQADLLDLRDLEKGFERLAVCQTFAAHGVDLSKNDFTQIQIR